MPPHDVVSITIELHDGRVIDVTHLPPTAIVDHLRALGVRLDDIKNTIHRIREIKEKV